MRIALLPISFVFALALSFAPAHAEMLDGKDLKSLITGKTVLLRTGYGFSLPLRYKPNGEVAGDGTGTMLARFFAPREIGKWWVEDDRLCQKWPSWYDGRTFCFVVRKTGDQTIEWRRNDGYRGTARISG